MNDDPEETLEQALRLSLAMTPPDRQATEDEVAQIVNMITGMFATQGKVLDRERLTRRLQELVVVFQEFSTGLEDPSLDHRPWLPEAKAERTWEFWERYRRYLESVDPKPRSVVRQLDHATDEILGQLEDPKRPGRWRRTGLVIGQVQSGKTGNYIGLAAKAIDAGYGLIVILAGIHNDLRSQTQLRVDEGLLGFDTQSHLRSDEGRRIGVGKMSHAKRLSIASLTNSSETGDFDRRTASKANIPLRHFPVVLIIKKNTRIIENLRAWVTDTHGADDSELGRKVVEDIPLFIIDDEADHASINTSKDPDNNPSKVNAAIRGLLNSFEKASYVGYTATPFANIYVDPDTDDDALGADLFPESFIRSLSAPSNYFGPERVFGLGARTDDEDDIDPLPVIRHVKDYSQWMPDGHKSYHAPPEDIPTSLSAAIDSFILTCATRRARGQITAHNSMLVHVTRFTEVQSRVRDQVEDYVRHCADSLRDRHGSARNGLLEQLHQLWSADFLPTSEAFPTGEFTTVTWDEVRDHLSPAIKKIQVKSVNGKSGDVLSYYENRRAGLSVIAIGGEKLSRGLTLEGLSVSYYLRHSKAYDTLLQMGRWFGYRPGYEDLCRLYTTPVLESAYSEITAATDELRRDIEEMAALDLTPRTFGHKVRASSLGLTVTAANKMRQGTKVLLSYSGEGPETVIFSLATPVVRNNFAALETLIGALESAHPAMTDQTQSRVWKNVPSETIVSTFFDRYQADRGAQRVRPRFIAEYISQCMAVGELTGWTVRLVSKSKPDRLVDVAGHKVSTVTRRTLKYEAGVRYTIRRVASPRDESLDILGTDQFDRALAATRKQDEASADTRTGEPRPIADVPRGSHVRAVRRQDQALLIIYLLEPPTGEALPDGLPIVAFAAGFPKSNNPKKTEYVVNSIYLQEDVESLLDDEDDQ